MIPAIDMSHRSRGTFVQGKAQISRIVKTAFNMEASDFLIKGRVVLFELP